MGLSTEEKVFIVEYYFRSYGSGHIHLDGYINRQTTRFLGFEWPDVIVQKPLHSAHMTIWCAVSAHSILGPYFIEDEERQCSVTQERYRDMVIRPFLQDLRRFCRARGLHMNRQWYQQDVATSHIARESLAMLQENFPGRIISHDTDFPYPSHSPDLTPPDAYLWGMLKECVFNCEDPPRTVPALRAQIVSFCRSLQQSLFWDMFENLRERYEHCLQRGGAHFEHLHYAYHGKSTR